MSFAKSKYSLMSKKLRLLRERIELLQRVDIVGPKLSRLFGFLQFRLHCILIEMANAFKSRVQNDELKQNSMALESMGMELSDSLHQAWTILQYDASCPPELKELRTLMLHSK